MAYEITVLCESKQINALSPTFINTQLPDPMIIKEGERIMGNLSHG